MWDKIYFFGVYKIFRIYDFKFWLIFAVFYCDCVVYYVLCKIIVLLVEYFFIYDIYVNCIGYGFYCVL